MAWNEPSENKNDKKDNDPWNRNRSSKNNSNWSESQFAKKFDKLFGGNKDPFKKNNPLFGITVILVIIIAFVSYLGCYTLMEAERAVVLQFGKINEITGPGLHWHIPLVETVKKVNVSSIRSTQTSGSMLTKDENVVDVEITVQYTISSPEEYLFNVAEPDLSLRQAIDSALRYVIGHTSMNEVITVGINEVRVSTHELLNLIIEKYNMGIKIENITFKAKAPDQVKAAFDDAISAQEDEQRFKSEAHAYSNDVIPKAEGQAQRLLEEAEAYKLDVVNKAKGDVAKFNKILPEYKQAPEITKRRLFLETMELVYANNPKVILNVKDKGNSMLYLPIDQMIKDKKFNNKGQN
jgi:membrane protease subunit HflK